MQVRQKNNQLFFLKKNIFSRCNPYTGLVHAGVRDENQALFLACTPIIKKELKQKFYKIYETFYTENINDILENSNCALAKLYPAFEGLEVLKEIDSVNCQVIRRSKLS